MQHPQVSSILALTSLQLQRKDKAMNEAVAALKTEKSTITTRTTQIDPIQKDLTVLKKDNPTLR